MARWYDRKMCPACRRMLIRADFGPSTVTADHKQELCKDCLGAKRRADQGRKYRETASGRVTTIMGGLTYRTKQAGRDMQISRDEVAQLLRKRKCYYCGCKLTRDNRVLDHVLPLSRGGDTTVENLVAACWDCNHEKSDYTLDEWQPRWYQKGV